MRRIIFGALAAALAAMVLSPAVLAAPPAADAPCTITGTEGNDTLVGTSGSDVICGLGGNDVIDGLGGDDTLRGGLGDDQLAGRDGDDRLIGEDGRDDLTGHAGNDIYTGGAGDDGASYLSHAVPVFVDLARGDSTESGVSYSHGNGLTGESDRIGSDVERITGSPFNDQIFGSARVESLSGGTGDDLLDGRAGNDFLAGGPGVDAMVGGLGTDLLVGGTGNDGMAGNDGVDTFAADAGADGDDVMDGGTGTDVISYFGRNSAVRIDLGDSTGDQGTWNPTTGASTEHDRLTNVEDARGTIAGDLIIGTSGPNRILSEGGNDEVRPLGGADTVEASTGDDFIGSRDQTADHIDCGPGTDEHQSDSIDTLVACETLVKPDTDMAVTAFTDVPDPVRVGEVLTYTATVRNLGTIETETAAELSFYVSPSLRDITVVSGDCGPVLIGHTNCSLPPLGPGGSATVAIQGIPTTAGTAGATAALTGLTSTRDPNPSNNNASALTIVEERETDIELVSVTANPNPGFYDFVDVIGLDTDRKTRPATIAVDLRNNGASSASATFALPSAVDVTEGSATIAYSDLPAECSGGSCTVALGGGERRVLELKATVSQHSTIYAASRMTATTAWTVEMSGAMDTAPGNNAASLTILADPTTADLSVVRAAQNVTPVAYSRSTTPEGHDQRVLDVDVTVEVHNAGPFESTIDLALPLPSFSHGHGSIAFPRLPAECDAARCTLENLPAGQSKTWVIGIRLTQIVMAHQNPPADLRATLRWLVQSGWFTPAETDTSNNVRTLTVVGTASTSDLSIGATYSPNPGTRTIVSESFPNSTRRSTVAVTLRVTNHGAQGSSARINYPTATFSQGTGSWTRSKLPPECGTTACDVDVAAGTTKTLTFDATFTNTVSYLNGIPSDEINATLYWQLRPRFAWQPADDNAANNQSRMDFRAVPPQADFTITGVQMVPATTTYTQTASGTAVEQTAATQYRVTILNRGPAPSYAQVAVPQPTFNVGTGSTTYSGAEGSEMICLDGTCTTHNAVPPSGTAILILNAIVRRTLTATQAASDPQMRATTTWRMLAGWDKPDPNTGNDSFGPVTFVADRQGADLAVTGITPSPAAPTFTTTVGTGTETHTVRPTSYAVTLTNNGDIETRAQLQLPTVTVANNGASGTASIVVYPNHDATQLPCTATSCAAQLQVDIGPRQSRTIVVLATVRRTIRTAEVPPGSNVSATTTWRVQRAAGYPPDRTPGNDVKTNLIVATEERADLELTSAGATPNPTIYQVTRNLLTETHSKRVLFEVAVTNKGPVLSSAGTIALPQPTSGTITWEPTFGCTTTACDTGLLTAGGATGFSIWGTIRQTTFVGSTAPMNATTTWRVNPKPGQPMDRATSNNAKTFTVTANHP